MNFIGKTFVLIYGMGSLFCLIVGMAVYTQKMDFVTPKGEDPKKFITRIDKAIERTKELNKADNRAYTRWVEEYDDLVKVEIDEVRRRDFYRGQLELVDTGKLDGSDVPDPVQVLPEQDPVTGLLAIDKPTGRDSVKFRTENVKPQSFYLAEIDKQGKEMETLLPQIQKLIADHAAATKELIGTETTKGFYKRINEQIKIAEDAEDERIHLEDYVTNRRADAQLLVKRKESLEARIATLLTYFKGR